MQRRIFGIENEYGVTCTLRGQRRLSPDEVARYLFRRVVSWGRSSNVFLANGARLYLDVGSHPEYATPECDSVRELVVHDKAGSGSSNSSSPVPSSASATKACTATSTCSRTTPTPPGTATAATRTTARAAATIFRRTPRCSFLPRQPPDLRRCRQGPADGAGRRYCVSQRAEHIWEGVSSATTRSRPIINTRDEPQPMRSATAGST